MRWVTSLVVCALTAVAAAQPGTTPPAPGTPPPAPGTPPPAPGTPPPTPTPTPTTGDAPPPPPPATTVPQGPDGRLDAGWQLYHEAFANLLAGKRRRAAELVAQLQREHPGHPAAQITMGTSLVLAPSTEDKVHARAELPSSGARAELALFQMFHGMVVGIELCALVECDSGGAIVASALLGGGVGAGVSLAQSNLTSGQRALLNSGTAWGAANAGLLMIAVQPDDYKAIILAMLAGQIGGLGIGAGLYALHPTSGQVGITNSGGQWALALTGLTLAAAQPDGLDEQNVSMMLLVAMDAGLGVGAYLADRYPRIGRGRGWVIDASGIVGAVGGGGLGVLVSGSPDERATPGLAAAGAVIGLGIGTYLTRDWDDDASDNDPGVRAVVLPVAHGRGATAGISLTW